MKKKKPPGGSSKTHMGLCLLSLEKFTSCEFPWKPLARYPDFLSASVLHHVVPCLELFYPSSFAPLGRALWRVLSQISAIPCLTRYPFIPNILLVMQGGTTGVCTPCSTTGQCWGCLIASAVRAVLGCSPGIAAAIFQPWAGCC